MDIGLPPMPKTETEQEASKRKRKFEALRDDFYTDLMKSLKTLSDVQLGNLRENLILSIMVAEQQKEYIYMLPKEAKDYLLESVTNSIQLRILVINEIGKRGLIK